MIFKLFTVLVFQCTGRDPLQLLITLGADINKADAVYLNTPLHHAVMNSNIAAVHTLLKCKSLRLSFIFLP